MSKIGCKLCDVFSHIYSWLAAFALVIAEYFAGHSFIVILVIIVTILDAIWGIAVSLKMKHFALSELARLTIAKLAVYGSALFVFVGIDSIIDSTITASVIGSAIVLVEFWSSCGSMSVLFPDFLFLRLMRKALIGEIARKLQISEDDVDNVLNHMNDEKE